LVDVSFLILPHSSDVTDHHQNKEENKENSEKKGNRPYGVRIEYARISNIVAERRISHREK
jgi:hypothetical protein